MPQKPNWAKLVEQNRAKAPGVPWSKDELKAIYKYHIHPDKVRRGILTLEQEKEQTDAGLFNKSFKQLVDIAKELHIEFDQTAVNKKVLMDVIASKRTANKKEEETLPKDTDLSSEEIVKNAKDVYGGEDNLFEMSYRDLQKLCKQKGLKASGKTEELIKRIKRSKE